MVALTGFDRDKSCWNSTACALCLTPTVSWSSPTPSVWRRGRYSPGNAGRRQFLFAGRLEELKGLPTVLEAWDLLGADAPDLLIAGEGPLGDWARAHAGPKVTFLGQLAPAELHRHMAESKGVLAASLCYESFALVPAEAHCLGTPVLASNLGNVGASVRPGIDGLRFAPGDARALAGAVGALLASSFDCEAIAAAARRTYNEEENYRALLRLYTKEER